MKQDGLFHKLIIKDCLRDEEGEVKAISRGVETIGKLTVQGMLGYTLTSRLENPLHQLGFQSGFHVLKFRADALVTGHLGTIKTVLCPCAVTLLE